MKNVLFFWQVCKKFLKTCGKKVRFSSSWICLCVKVKMLFTRAGGKSGRRFAPKKLKIGFVPCNLFFALKVSDILKKSTNVNKQLTQTFVNVNWLFHPNYRPWEILRSYDKRKCKKNAFQFFSDLLHKIQRCLPWPLGVTEGVGSGTPQLRHAKGSALAWLALKTRDTPWTHRWKFSPKIC